jgi:hypothetical protein
MLHLFDSEEQDLTDSGCSVGHGSLFSWKPQTVMTVWIRPDLRSQSALPVALLPVASNSDQDHVRCLRVHPEATRQFIRIDVGQADIK